MVDLPTADKEQSAAFIVSLLSPTCAWLVHPGARSRYRTLPRRALIFLVVGFMVPSFRDQQRYRILPFPFLRGRVFFRSRALDLWNE